jgi:hypothetical protein
MSEETKRETYEIGEIVTYFKGLDTDLPSSIFEPLREQLNAKFIKYVFGSKFFPGENHSGWKTNMEDRKRYGEAFKEYRKRCKAFMNQ